MVNLNSLADSMFGWVSDRYGEYFSIVKDSIPKADIYMTFRTYMSMVFMTASMAYVSTFFALALALGFVEISAMMKVVYLLFVPFMVAIATVVILVFYPYQKMMDRRKSIETNFPFVLTHMGAVAESGVPPYVIFKLISQFDEYGEVAAEMRKVVRNMENFGLDPLKAVKEVAERTPSDKMKQMLLGFVTTTESGGDVKLYLKGAGEQALFDWRIKRERFLQQLSAYAEFYTGILIAAPLFIIALFAVMNMIQPTVAGFDILFLTKVSIYGAIPLLNIGFLLFLRGMEVEM
ncbi:MAG: type II secretion system F family protein [Candidatus Aenigmatarchaeota archaeon]